MLCPHTHTFQATGCYRFSFCSVIVAVKYLSGGPERKFTSSLGFPLLLTLVGVAGRTRVGSVSVRVLEYLTCVVEHEIFFIV